MNNIAYQNAKSLNECVEFVGRVIPRNDPDVLIVLIDLKNKDMVPSKRGRSLIVASTGGFIPIFNSDDKGHATTIRQESLSIHVSHPLPGGKSQKPRRDW